MCPPHPSNQSILKEINSTLKIHWKDWSWSANTLAAWCKELTHWKRSWCWERSKAGGEGDNREWDSWMASPTQWTWVWASFGSRWWTGKPGLLQSTGLQVQTWLSDWTELVLEVKMFLKKKTRKGLCSTQRLTSLLIRYVCDLFCGQVSEQKN